MSTIEPRDSELDRLYREAGGDEPSPRLDAAILARARSAAAQPADALVAQGASAPSTSATPRDGRAGSASAQPPSELWPFRHPRSWLMRWRVPLAVAATLLVSGTVTLMLQDAGMPGLPRSGPAPDGNGMPAARGVIREAPPRASAADPSVQAPPAAPDARLESPPPSTAESRASESKAKEATAAGEQRRERRAEAPKPTAPPPPGNAVKDEQVPLARPDASEAQPSMRPEARAPAKAAEMEAAAPAPQPRPSQRDVAEDGSPSVASRDSAVAQPAPPNELESPRRAPAPQAYSAPAPRERRALRESAAPYGARPDAPPDGTTERAPMAVPAPTVPAVAEATTPEAMIERIRALRRAGREDEARKLLRELADRYPEYKLPEDLRPPP